MSLFPMTNEDVKLYEEEIKNLKNKIIKLKNENEKLLKVAKAAANAAMIAGCYGSISTEHEAHQELMDAITDYDPLVEKL